MVKTIEKQKMSTAQHLEQVLNSSEFRDFCDFQCALKDHGCRHYCAIFTLSIKLGRKV